MIHIINSYDNNGRFCDGKPDEAAVQDCRALDRRTASLTTPVMQALTPHERGAYRATFPKLYNQLLTFMTRMLAPKPDYEGNEPVCVNCVDGLIEVAG